MPRYRLTVTAQLTQMSSVDLARLRLLADASAVPIAADMLRIVLVREGRDARCAAERAYLDISEVLPAWRFARPPVWSARQLGLLGFGLLGRGRRSSGRLPLGGDDDGLSGVREPRRPHPSSGSAAVALDLPAF
jgi:hypothetical protein